MPPHCAKMAPAPLDCDEKTPSVVGGRQGGKLNQHPTSIGIRTPYFYMSAGWQHAAALLPYCHHDVMYLTWEALDAVERTYLKSHVPLDCNGFPLPTVTLFIGQLNHRHQEKALAALCGIVGCCVYGYHRISNGCCEVLVSVKDYPQLLRFSAHSVLCDAAGVWVPISEEGHHILSGKFHGDGHLGITSQAISVALKDTPYHGPADARNDVTAYVK